MALQYGSPAWHIKHDLFEVSIPAAYAENEFDQKQFGYVMTGNRSLDSQLASEQRLVARSIESLVELHAEGVDIRLVNPKQSQYIYEKIKEHLADAEHYFNRIRISRTETEEDKALEAEIVRDLELLAKFADAVHITAKAAVEEPVSPNGLLDFFRKISGRNITATTLSEQLASTTAHTTTYEKFEERLEKAALVRTQRWKSGGF